VVGTLWWWVLAACKPSESDGTEPTTDTHVTIYKEDTASGTTDTATTYTTPPDPVTESFTYTAVPVDILLVIDASSSMVGHTESMIGALESLVDTWIARNIDFRVGVLNIDEDEVDDDHGHLIEIAGLKWVEPTSPTPGLLLREMVDSVDDPSTVESGRMAVYKALELMGPGEPNEGFLREGTELAIVVHGDETDQSVGVTPQEFVDYIVALRPDPLLRGFHSIVGTDDYLDLTTQIGGIAWSVDNEPYGPALDAITATIEGNNAFVVALEANEDYDITARVTEPDGTVVDLTDADVTYDEDTRTVDLGTYFPITGATVEITYYPI
jgi:hypothetical protein